MTLKKGVWSPEEDNKLIAYINRYGIWNWTKMPEPAGLSRSGKSCRLRWLNYLRPNVKHGEFTSEEDQIITRMHKLLGNKWSTIAAALPGRTDNEIKNHWHTRLQKLPRRRFAKHPQMISMTDDSQSQLNPASPKENYSEYPTSMSPYILDSSAETSSSTSASSTGTNCECSEQKAVESPDVPNYFREDSYLEDQYHILDEISGFREFWDLKPMSPFGFYASSSLSSNFPMAEDVEGVFIDPIFQFE